MKFVLFLLTLSLMSMHDICAAAAVEEQDMLKLNYQLVGHKALVRAALALRDGKFATGSDDTTVRLWNLKTQQATHVFTGHIGPVTCLANLVDDRVIISGS